MVIAPSQGLKGALIRGRITAERRFGKVKLFVEVILNSKMPTVDIDEIKWSVL